LTRVKKKQSFNKNPRIPDVVKKC